MQSAERCVYDGTISARSVFVVCTLLACFGEIRLGDAIIPGLHLKQRVLYTYYIPVYEVYIRIVVAYPFSVLLLTALSACFSFVSGVVHTWCTVYSYDRERVSLFIYPRGKHRYSCSKQFPNMSSWIPDDKTTVRSSKYISFRQKNIIPRKDNAFPWTHFQSEFLDIEGISAETERWDYFNTLTSSFQSRHLRCVRVGLVGKNVGSEACPRSFSPCVLRDRHTVYLVQRTCQRIEFL